MIRHSLKEIQPAKSDIMAQSLVFSLLGDSNIHRHVNKNSLRASPALQAAQILQCGHQGIFTDVLAKVRAESSACIVACLTNFLSRTDGPVAVSHRVEPVLLEVREAIFASCESHPDRAFLLSPPMYRTHPVWYREGLAEILTIFSRTMSSRPPNLHILPSFATPDYDPDGVHLTPYSGLEYLLHLFDSSADLLSSLTLSPETVSARGQESTRVLEDRVMVLEQDHRRLNSVVENKTAVDAELADFHENERMENWFVIEGLSAISGDLVGKAWQDQALKDVQAVLLILMGREFQIVFVKNSTSRARDAPVTYSVQLAEVSESRAIRKKFGSFYLGGQDKRPPALKKINIKIRVTEETKTRISVLKLLAARYKNSNPGSKVQVISYDPRPLIKITPASSASDRRIKIFNYVEAVKNLPTNFSQAEVEPIIRRINPKLAGSVRAIFIVLSDDQFRERIAKFPKVKAPVKSNTVSSQSSQPETETEDIDVDVDNIEHSSSARTSGPVQVHRSRSGKRGAPPVGGPAKEKKTEKN